MLLYTFFIPVDFVAGLRHLGQKSMFLISRVKIDLFLYTDVTILLFFPERESERKRA